MSYSRDAEKREGKRGAETLSFAAAGALLLICFALLWVVGKAVCIPLFYIGWALLLAGLVLIALPLTLLPREGRARRGEGLRHTTTVARTGLYAVIRHPLYLGWMLGFVALILLAQHWLVAVLAVPGIACVYLITIQEEERLVSKFGREYVRYAKDVPRFNILAGALRVARRKKTT
jgi:protein-S-isoprenylcysteine O-methyltransferase Ste14